MPKESMDYSKCIIYKIQHINNDELLYVGHTTNFNKRKYNHKSSVNNEKGNLYNLKLYQMIRENGGWDNFNMIVIKEFPCQNLREAEAEEDKVMREMKATMNMIRAFHPKEEWCEDNKEKLQEYRHQYYQDNKEYKIEYQHQFYVENKERILEQNRGYREKNKEQIKERHRQWYEKNKEKIQEYKHQYGIKNKEQIKERSHQWREKNKEKIHKRINKVCLCECGKEYTLTNKLRHEKSKFHLNFICSDTDPPSSSQPEFVSS